MTPLPPGVEALTDEQIDKAVAAWFGHDTQGSVVPAGPNFRARMRAAIAEGARAGYLAGLEEAAKVCEQSPWPYVVPAIRSLKGETK